MVVWTSAWLNGAAAADDVLDALQTWAEVHEVRAADYELAAHLELPGPEGTPAGPALLLAALRRIGSGQGVLVLPVSGDARGLDGSTRFSQQAMRAGEAAVLPGTSVGLVPEQIAEGIVRWTAHPLDERRPDENVPIGEAEHGMASAMREAASTLVDLGVAKERPGVREEIARAVESSPAPGWPADSPQRAVRVLQRAAEVHAILHVATDDAPGAAVSASAMRKRTEALRPLFDAVRSARCAAVAEMARVLADSTPRS